MSDETEDEYGDEEEDDFLSTIWLEAVPLSKYHFIHFFFTVLIGILRTLLEAVANFANAVTGAEVYESNKKEFEDQARLSIDMIADGTEE